MSKLCVISGATSGIGRTAALELAARGIGLAVIGRSAEKGEALRSAIHAEYPGLPFYYYQADVSSIAQCKAVAEAIRNDHPVIDILINNAGGVFSNFELTEDGIEKTIANNHLGYYIITLTLLENLMRSGDPRIVIVSSGSHYRQQLDFDRFTEPKGYQIMTNYGQSKLANMLFAYALADRLKDTEVRVNALHPGVVKTDIGNKSDVAFHRFMWTLFSKLGGISTSKAAATYVMLATSPEARNYHGKYFHAGKIKASSKVSYDKALGERLWEWSAGVTGVDMPAPTLE